MLAKWNGHIWMLDAAIILIFFAIEFFLRLFQPKEITLDWCRKCCAIWQKKKNFCITFCIRTIQNQLWLKNVCLWMEIIYWKENGKYLYNNLYYKSKWYAILFCVGCDTLSFTLHYSVWLQFVQYRSSERSKPKERNNKDMYGRKEKKKQKQIATNSYSSLTLWETSTTWITSEYHNIAFVFNR